MRVHWFAMPVHRKTPPKKRSPRPERPAFVVLQELTAGTWRILGEVERRPGLTARAARAQAVEDMIGKDPTQKECYAAVLRSEWRIAAEW